MATSSDRMSKNVNLSAAEWVPLADLEPWSRNARQHSDDSTRKLAAGIRRFGFLVPITAWRDERRIAAGHGRRFAMQAILHEDPGFIPRNAPDGVGPGMVPVMWEDFATEAQFEAFALADNRQAKNAEDAADLVAQVLYDLDQQGLDLDGMGFDDDEIALLLEGVGAVSDDEWGNALGDLPEGDRAPIQTMTFTLHDDQVEQVKAAIAAAKGLGDFGDTGNENSNGNALARVCETFLTEHGHE